jgi:CubicO group peptidase (beta-lactamase class C family)
MKLLKRILLFLGLPLLIVFIVFINYFAPIIAGFGAKDLCSCVYVSNRDVESVLENELGSYPLAIGTFTLNPEDKSATGSVFGFAEVKAIYRVGLGCTLIRQRNEEEIRAELPKLDIVKPVLNDTAFWPIGTKATYETPDNIDKQKLQKVIDEAFVENDPEHPQKTRSVIIVYKGRIIAEKYTPGFDAFTPHIGWSMGKSVTNSMFGVLVQKRGFDIYKPAPIPEWADTKDPRHQITTDQLLRMSSGLEWEENYSKPSSATNMLYVEADMGKFASMQKAEKQPDQEWYYSSGTTNILSRILKLQLSDDTYFQWPYRELFYKLGVTSAVFEMDASNTFVGSSYLWASPRDWARLGLLYLNDGIWEEERILPEGWAAYSANPTPKSTMLQYGAQFWLNAGDPIDPSNRRLPDCPRDLYMMDGYESQRVYIIPSYDMVIVRLGQTKKGDFDFNEFVSGVLSAVLPE